MNTVPVGDRFAESIADWYGLEFRPDVDGGPPNQSDKKSFVTDSWLALD